MMSPTDGWQVLRQLKSDTQTRNIPVVVLSIVDDQDMGFRLGAVDYLVKPLEREAILDALARIAPPRTPPEVAQLLVVDDDPQVCDLVSQLLEDEPYAITSAQDGMVALQAIGKQRPDVVLLDLLMPEMDGFEVIQHLCHHPQLSGIPVIVLTAKELTPAEVAQLQRCTSRILQKSGLQRETLLRELRDALQELRQGALLEGASDEEDSGH